MQWSLAFATPIGPCLMCPQALPCLLLLWALVSPGDAHQDRDGAGEQGVSAGLQGTAGPRPIHSLPAVEQLGCGGAQVSAYFRVDSGAFRFLLPPLLAANQFVFGCFLQRDAFCALSFVSPNRLGRYSQASKQFAKAVEEVAAVVASVWSAPC